VREHTTERQKTVQTLMWAAWPGFLTAICAEIVFFAVFDPLDFNMRLTLSREAVYSVGFAAFWVLGTMSSALTLFLQRPPGERTSPTAATIDVGDDWR
jgi:hypothetical protein